MTAAVNPTPFETGFRLIDGNTLNTNFAHPVLSSQDAITAKASGTQSTATQITTRVTRVSTVATAADAVKLPASAPGKVFYIINDASLPMQVFGTSPDTINDVATATGISQTGHSLGVYACSVKGKWYATIFSLIGGGRSGTFTATGSSVTVTNANITANSVVAFGLNTVGGTIAGAPYMLTVTPGTGFTVNAGASDTSVYNYTIIN